jgi:hypothetical protein
VAYNIFETFSEFVYSVLSTRFQHSKMIKKKTEEFLVGIQNHHSQDERIDSFMHFVGLTDNSILTAEILDLYLKIMESTDISLLLIMSPEESNKEFLYADAFDRLLRVFRNLSMILKQELIK